MSLLSQKNQSGRMCAKKQNNNIKILTAKDLGAVSIYVTTVCMKPKAPSLIAPESHLNNIYLQPNENTFLCDDISDIYLQPDESSFLRGDVNIDHKRETSKK